MIQGDLVVCINDEKKIIYVIDNIIEDKLHLKGLNYRIRKVVLMSEIRIASLKEIDEENEYNKKYLFRLENFKKRNLKKYLLGKVLHVDGDNSYLDKCMELYKTVGVFANGISIKEQEMPLKIKDVVLEYSPDIIVLTGHDMYNGNDKKNLNNYTNTLYFMNTVREIRKNKCDYSCAVVAGACQSNFEALIASGANFASSPERINIHTFDPAVIAIKIATTSFTKVVSLEDAFKYIELGRKAFGGIETLGKMRLMM